MTATPLQVNATVTVRDAARALGVSRQRLMRAVHAGEIGIAVEGTGPLPHYLDAESLARWASATAPAWVAPPVALRAAREALARVASRVA